MPSHILAEIPSPQSGEWQLGPFPLRAYALAILLGIFVAVWLANRRWMERGGESGQIIDIAMWAVPFGIVGGRIYHVISSPAAYFGEGGDPLKAFAIWEGGLGIWGAIALGGVGVAIGARRMGIRFSVLRSEEHTSELQSRGHLVCRLLLEKKKLQRHCVIE